MEIYITFINVSIITFINICDVKQCDIDLSNASTRKIIEKKGSSRLSGESCDEPKISTYSQALPIVNVTSTKVRSSPYLTN
ncbi:hypothetical protein VCRA2128O305_20376 [Vibrio crassostreae]|nr:hypothetical protein VCRA2113O228_100028 [Vibrio crassostreae]CAK1709062.1 hypothetical protein VCRA2110O178_100158 [Vibrio crassostreae]CAK1844477.1 hypothetical protein VCRA2110O175_10163 [Vibrio crassostreae]CAK1847524.1 hypothetical protein VCRA2113O221_10157 [Vibrio crassostreae]CAK1850451.1 hypothetical protein VCRA2113O231_10152 [Vibrio crassostreae]